MAWRLFGAKLYYLNKCWIFNGTLRNKLQWNFNQNTKLFIHENASENIACEMAAILSRGRWVNIPWQKPERIYMLRFWKWLTFWTQHFVVHFLMKRIVFDVSFTEVHFHRPNSTCCLDGFLWPIFRARRFPLPNGPGQVKLPVRQVDLNSFFFFISYKQIKEFQISWSRASADFEKRRALILLRKLTQV